jgi:hypothetical protein
MKSHFYIKDDTESEHIIATETVELVTVCGEGIHITTKGGRIFTTNTYDLRGFAAWVLDDGIGIDELDDA